MENRFYQAPHCTGFGVAKPGAQAHHRAVKAEGGWGAVTTEACSIHPSSEVYPVVEAELWDDTDVARLAWMSDKVHEYGALAGVELWYGGMWSFNGSSRQPPRGPSQIPCE